MVVAQAEKVLLFSQDTNLTSLLLEAKDLEARVIILSARFVREQGDFSWLLGLVVTCVCVLKWWITTSLQGRCECYNVRSVLSFLCV